jgi:hypothetical protein
MASAQMPRGYNPRGSGRMDSQQENFEKTQVLLSTITPKLTG